MLIATCILAGATAVIAISSLWAIVTWRENRQREARESIQERTLEQARKEFAPKENVTNLITVLAVGAGLAVLAMWPKKD